jgi:hypothetical protein
LSLATMEEREKTWSELGKKAPIYRSLQIQLLCAVPAQAVLPLGGAVPPLWTLNLLAEVPRGAQEVLPLPVPLRYRKGP